MTEAYPRKLIEVALPLEAISRACQAEKNRKTGTIRNVHKWFAPMPSPAWRALLFAALIDDPGDDEGRQELLRLVADLVPEDGTVPSEAVVRNARLRIAKAFNDAPPTLLDPFCGGGSTLIEGQRLGLHVVGSDLNPVPVLISRFLVEHVPRVEGKGPFAAPPETLQANLGGPLEGFLSDLRYFAERTRMKAWDRLSALYPQAVEGGMPIAWLWARTVTCPSPACQATAPLTTSFWLSKRRGAKAWIQPVIKPDKSGVIFEVRTGDGEAPSPTKVARGGNFRCIVCAEAIPEAHVKAQGLAGHLGAQLMAVSIDGPAGRSYVDGAGHEPLEVDRPLDAPDIELADDSRALWAKLYGLRTVADHFTNRQLRALGEFADAVSEVVGEVRETGADEEYVKAIASALALCVGKLAMSSSTQVRWKIDSRNGSAKAQPAFGRHSLPMAWDFVETNPFGASVGDWLAQVEYTILGLRTLPKGATPGVVVQRDARAAASLLSEPGLVATDPPYFGQIGYADLSDYFYVWHRRALHRVEPDLYATIATPKEAELVAAPHRHDGGMKEASEYFVRGFTTTFSKLMEVSRPELPTVVVYAHRQEETSDGSATVTGWDAMLTAMLDAGLAIVGTWPVHATHSSRQIGLGTNALASYVILICRGRREDAGVASRRDLIDALRSELPDALRALQRGSTAPVDLAQAAIGPGMAVFSRYAKVIEADGSPMSVRTALGLINQSLEEVLAEQEADFDADTRFAIAWFAQYGSGEGPFGQADVLARAKDTAVTGLRDAGILTSRAGKVRLLSRPELAADWDPTADHRLTVWEVAQHLIKRLETGGEGAAADLLRRVGGLGETARELAYRLFVICERQGWAQEALGYNALGAAWAEIARLAAAGSGTAEQQQLRV